MKRFMTIMIIILVIGVIGVGSYFGFTEFAVTGIIDENKFYKPVFGFMECKSLDSIRYYPSIDKQPLYFDDEVVFCKDTATLTQDCTLHIQLPTNDEVDGSIGYLCVATADKNSPVPDNCGKAYYTKGFGGEYAGQEVNVQLGESQIARISYHEGSVFKELVGSVDAVNNKASYKIAYYPFFIFSYNYLSPSNGAYDPKTTDCTFDNNFLRENAIIESVGSGLDLPSGYTLNIQNSDALREPNRRISMIIDYLPADIETFTMIDNNKYCVDYKVYPIVDVETTAGTIRVADVATTSVIDRVGCCNDYDAVLKNGPGSYCDENFEIQIGSQSDCQVDSDCTLSQPTAGIDNAVYYETCVDGGCVMQREEVECTSGSQCLSGVCDYDSRNPENSECISIEAQDFCGNDLCEASRNENENTCADDCAPPGDTGIPEWLTYSLLGAAVLAVFAAIGKKGKGKLPGAPQIPSVRSL